MAGPDADRYEFGTLSTEGQKVFVQPIETASVLPLEAEQADRLREIERLFAEWTEEDGKLSDEEADLLENALRRENIGSEDCTQQS